MSRESLAYGFLEAYSLVFNTGFIFSSYLKVLRRTEEGSDRVWGCFEKAKIQVTVTTLTLKC